MNIEKNGSDIVVTLKCGTKTTISHEDEWILKEFPCWNMTGSMSRYVIASRSIHTEYSSLRENIYLHRIITKAKKNENVDHRDRDRLNNRRSNLRICSFRENCANVGPKNGKKFKGVFFDAKRNLKKGHSAYVSFLDAKGRGLQKRRYLGRFSSAEEAAKAYDSAAKEIWGEFAYQNFPEER